MRTFFFPVLLVLFFFQSLFCFSNSYNDFRKALRSKRYHRAATIIRTLHFRSPRKKLYHYWYGYALYRSKRYAAAARVFSRLSSRYRPLSRVFYLSRSLELAGKRRQAVRVLYKALHIPEKRKGYYSHFYNILVRSLIVLKRGRELDSLFKKAVRYYKASSLKKGRYFFYKYGRWCVEQAVMSLKKGNSRRARGCFNKALQVAKLKIGRYRRYIRLYKYPDQLRRMKRYKKALAAYDAISRYKMGPNTSFAYVATLIQAGKKARAKKLLFSLLNVSKSQLGKYSIWNWSRAIRQLVQLKQEQLIARYEPWAWAAYRKRGKQLSKLVLYRIARGYVNRAFRLVAKGKDRAALKYIRLAQQKEREGLGKYGKYLTRMRLALFNIMLRFWVAKKMDLSRAYKHRFLVLVVSDLDARFADKKGRPKHVVDHIPRSRIPQYRQAFEVLRRLYFYYTRGQINMQFVIRYHRGTIRDVRRAEWRSKIRDRNGNSLRRRVYYSPVIESITSDPGKIIYAKRAVCDTLLVVFPSKGVTRTSTGGLVRMMYVPAVLYSSELRGKINIAGSSFSERSYRLLAHEFFHVVEGAYARAKRIRMITHVYRRIYRGFWPNWYRGEGELIYYENAFKHLLRPYGTRCLHFRKKGVLVTQSDWIKAKRALRNYSYSSLRRADALWYKGEVAFRAKKYSRALHYYKKSYAIFPKSLRVAKRLAYLYSKNRERRKSRKIYIAIGSLPGASSKDIQRAAYYLHRSGNREKADHLIRSIDKAKMGAKDLYKSGRRFERQRKYKLAKRRYLRCLNKYPQSGYSAWSLYRLIYFLTRYQKKYQEAIRYGRLYWRFVKEDRMARTVAFYLGRAYGEAGRRKSAIFWLHRAKRLRYNRSRVRQYLRKYGAIR